MRVKYCQLITSVLARQAWMLCLQYKHCCHLFDYFQRSNQLLGLWMKSYNRFLKECTIVLSGLGVLLSSLKLLLRFLASCFDNGSLGSPLGSPLGPLGSLPSLAFLASFTSLLSSLLLPLRVCQFIQHSLFYINTSCFHNYSNSPVFPFLSEFPKVWYSKKKYLQYSKKLCWIANIAISHLPLLLSLLPE